ncbi:YceD family protein [Velocimicrobium porci]|uniref:DUF177 domain-containing protein n=1 Tax=Velocimicrobium porci TaxID=2606634 RepID=A0A6L5XXF0_9FIRM|nr:DUF177 domain-containing protein [Velocimicrobium porci]MSS63304.1 DUF177 domain-containing protein [Velocimicrobium porci]
MIIQLSDIMSGKDKMKHIEAPIELNQFKLDGMEYEFVKKNPVAFCFTVTGEKRMLVEGKTSLSLLIPCGRCLDDVEIPFDIEISKDLDFNNTDADRIKELDELNYIDGYNLDVDLLIFDEILVHFPLQVLCSEDCKGICKVCGTNLNKESCSCDQSVGDPRMSAIQDIFKNFKEV